MDALPQVVKILCDKFQFHSQIDLFATHLNKQIDKYVSWMPNPHCIAANFSWKTQKYAFPPFSLVRAAISKIIKQHHWDHDYTQLDNKVLVPNNAHPSGRSLPSAPF